MNELLNSEILNSNIDYNKIKENDFIIAFEKLIPQVKEEFENILNGDLSYLNLFESNLKFKHLNKVIDYLNHLNGVSQTDKLREIYGNYVPKISLLFSEMYLDERYYDKIVSFKDTLEYKKLSNDRKKIIIDIIKNLEYEGINLDKFAKERLNNISFELTSLSEKFENNLMDVQNTYEKIVHLSEINDLPQRCLDNLEVIDEFNVKISEVAGNYSDILTYSKNRNLRKSIYEEQLSLGVKDGFDNKPIITKILNLRQEKAKILGYNSYAEYSLNDQMLNSPTKVYSFISKIAKKAIKQAKKDQTIISNYGKKILNDNVTFYDRAFIIEDLFAKACKINQEEIRKYFPVDSVLNGLFKLINSLYNISFVENKTKSTWHTDVLSFDVFDNDKFIGNLYLDLYKRKNKESGAWMSPFQSYENTEFSQKTQVTYLVLNIVKNQKGISTLNFDDVITLFHEMGHALHNILSKEPEDYYSGLSNVEHDAIELPSQFMENFVWDYEVIKLITNHVENNQIMPTKVFNKLKENKNFLVAGGLINQCIFSYLDMKIHDNELDFISMEKQIFNQWKYKDIDPRNNFLSVFSHIFAGGYAAGYYSYKWSEVLSSDAYAALKEEGKHYFNQQKMALNFKDNILSVGGKKSMAYNYKKFRGKSPNIIHLLNNYGIN